MRTRYPAASVDALARLATLEAIRARRSQASLVLTVAAVYGRDPASPERVPELLELLQAPRLASPRTKDFAKAGRVLAALAVRRLAARVIPFGGLLAESVLSGRSLDDVARRTLAYYGSRDGKRAFTNR
jgi:hypothetical protein